MAMLKRTIASHIVEEEEDDEDEEPGEVIESAPPLKVGEEREINSSGIKKKLLKRGSGWETPEFGDEVTVRYLSMLIDGEKQEPCGDKIAPTTFKLGQELDFGIATMKKGEVALFTVPFDTDMGSEASLSSGVSRKKTYQNEVELVSWMTVVDVCKDGGIIKKISRKGESGRQPSDLDQVLVKYQIMSENGTVVSETEEEGTEFYINDGHLIPAFPRVIKTMTVGEKAILDIQPQYGFGDVGMLGVDGLPLVAPNTAMRIDLELVSYKTVTDITGDSKIVKKIIKEGDSIVVADDGASVTVRYVGKLEDGTIFEKRGFDGSAPLEFTTDEEQVISGLDRAISTMKKGELAVLTISHEYGFGSTEVTRDLAKVPPFSNLLYEVEMLDFVKEKAPWEMTSQEKIETAEKKKEEGNALFKCGKYQRAGKKYDKASDYVSEERSFNDEEQKLIKPLRVSCWLNGAACSLKMNEFNEVIRLCSKVLDIEIHNIKALYRRAQAFIENADLDLAALDIKKALEVDPDNREVKLLQKNLKQRQDESNKRDANLYMNMFSRLTKDTTVVTKKLRLDDEQVAAMEVDSASVEAKIVDSS
ncbi:hypothetical protein V2J09_023864 [Rumex salicifolius]